MNTVIEAVGPFWFVVFSVLAIGGPLAVFVIGFAIAKRLGYSSVGIILTVVLTLLAIGPALAFMFTQWTISGTLNDVSEIIPAVGWAGVGITVLWIGGGWALGWLIEQGE
jgi:hypothetical protein